MQWQDSEIYQRWVPAYERVGQRHRSIWRWCWDSFEQTTLACVQPALRDRVQAIKMLAVLWNAMLDDLADVQRDPRLLEAAISAGTGVATAAAPDELRGYLALVGALRREVDRRATRLPGADACASLLHFDLHNVIQSFRWGLVANNHPECLEWTEYERHQPHNFMMQYVATLDLAASPTLPPGEWAVVRQLSWLASCCGNLANSLATWEGELRARDVSSAVAQLALQRGALRGPADMSVDAAISAVHASGAVEIVTARWAEMLARCDALARRVRSFDGAAYVAGTRGLLASLRALPGATGHTWPLATAV